MGPEVLCWCGFSHRGNRDNAYTCQPFSVLKDRPELLSAFRACGCDPERGEVGIMLERDLRSNAPHERAAGFSAERPFDAVVGGLRDGADLEAE